MAQLNWSEPARDDLEEIIRYYGNFSHKTAVYYSEEDCRQNPNTLKDSDRFESLNLKSLNQ